MINVVTCSASALIPHLSLSSWDRASSSCLSVEGGRETESRTRFRLASRARVRGPNCPGVPVLPGRVGTLGASLSRAELRDCRWVSRVKKQEGHVSQAGKESQWPRLQESQRAPEIPTRQEHTPVCLLQTSGTVPSASHRHAGKKRHEDPMKSKCLYGEIL